MKVLPFKNDYSYIISIYITVYLRYFDREKLYHLTSEIKRPQVEVFEFCRNLKVLFRRRPLELVSTLFDLEKSTTNKLNGVPSFLFWWLPMVTEIQFEKVLFSLTQYSLTSSVLFEWLFSTSGARNDVTGTLTERLKVRTEEESRQDILSVLSVNFILVRLVQLWQMIGWEHNFYKLYWMFGTRLRMKKTMN